jgi:hypothetical protein
MNNSNSPGFDQARIHAIKDRQGKVYLAQAEELYWILLDGTLLPKIGYRDLGTIEVLLNKLAQYRHASKILLSQTQNNFLNNIELFREIDKDEQG